ncbi:TPA: hypothetical protein DIV55_04675 [Patescibacteria group bacterium]|uniref:Glycosyltransferase RgtA/B/C/D-like domain-containing protein n=1 Tax=Candidatus Gottesmanbacteria bacterium GW2011_GWA1_43_11 TaxID=1618436 RepID=A0A0G1ES11_9BACT|nr:MAG: hypothetical protein UV59_C0004G0004 [Candidatus Gottesmanbacteria bacterium GW2011_GWA1_43_11]HCS79007.1 hypothetical protein [Patescibacteria group bacterium]
MILIVGLALILRVYNLGSNPPSVYGDEQSFAWNAWNILKTGTDEYGTPWPLQFRAFDDYKAPIPVYLLVPFLSFGGLQTFVVRLPVALFGTATVYLLYLLVKQFDLNKQRSEKIALVSALLLAISPWHLHLSRGYFESTIALFFFVSAIYFFVKAREKNNYLSYSSLFFVLTLYTYFTPRIVILLFIPFLLWWGKDWVFKAKQQLVYAAVILFVLTLPLVKISLFDKGLSRIDKLTDSRSEQIVREVERDRNGANSPLFIKTILHNRPFYWVRILVNDYIEQFSVNFLFLYGDSSLRYGIGNFGMLYLVTWPFFLIGFPVLFIRQRKIFWLLIGWMAIVPLPAAVVGRPFAVRSLALVPALVIFSAAGIVYMTNMPRKTITKRIIAAVLGLGIVCSLGYYLFRYHLEYPSYAATWWGWENKAALDLAFKSEKNYDQVFLSNFYSGMDLAFAYYTADDPIKFRTAKANQITLADNRQQIQLGKFYIGSLDIDDERLRAGILPPRTLYIGRPEEADSTEIISAPDDGRILFKIYRTQ